MGNLEGDLNVSGRGKRITLANSPESRYAHNGRTNEIGYQADAHHLKKKRERKHQEKSDKTKKTYIRVDRIY